MELVIETEDKKLKKSLLQEMAFQDCYYKALCEIVRNLDKKKFKLSKSVKNQLRSEVKIIAKILSKPISRAKRASTVKQSGGFLNIVIPALIPFIGKIISDAIS